MYTTIDGGFDRFTNNSLFSASYILHIFFETLIHDVYHHFFEFPRHQNVYGYIISMTLDVGAFFYVLISS